MKLFISLLLVMIPINFAWSSHIFHMEVEDGACNWKLYNVEKDKDRIYYRTEVCPDQIVWLKDKSFFFSVKNEVFWANQWVKVPKLITNINTARKDYPRSSEVIWGVKGKHNSIHAMVIDPKIKYMRVNKRDTYEYQGEALDPDSYTGSNDEARAAGIIRRWSPSKKDWITESIKVVGRYNNTGFDQNLYNNSVLSTRQIIHYNECGGANCEELPKHSFWDLSQWEKKLNFVDDGIQSMGYLPLDNGKGLLFKKAQGESLHTVKPFILCENDCETMNELELPRSFSDNYSVVKKGRHYLVTNEDRGSIGNLYGFHSTKPIKTFRGPMVFWHPF